MTKKGQFLRKLALKTPKNRLSPQKLELALPTRHDPTRKWSAPDRLEPAKGRLEPIPSEIARAGFFFLDSSRSFASYNLQSSRKLVARLELAIKGLWIWNLRRKARHYSIFPNWKLLWICRQTDQDSYQSINQSIKGEKEMKQMQYNVSPLF